MFSEIVYNINFVWVSFSILLGLTLVFTIPNIKKNDNSDVVNFTLISYGIFTVIFLLFDVIHMTFTEA